MTSVVDEAVSQQRRAVGPFLRLFVALVAAVAAVVLLLSGFSYPGYPVDNAAVALLAAVTSVTLVVVSAVRAGMTGRGRASTAVVLALVTLLFATGVLAARADDGERLQARWAASQSAFEQELRTAGYSAPAVSSLNSGAPYPGTCPVEIGEFAIVECRSIDGGFLFLQSQDALTDDSGIVYLPADEVSRSGFASAETLAPLGGPWWSWTCYC